MNGGGSFLALALIVLGVVLIVAGVRGTTRELGKALS